MRATLDIDDDVLEAVQERARVENKTAGQVLSELVRQELARMSGAPIIVDGIPVLPSRGGVVTKELVDKIQEEIDLEDMRRAIGKPRSDQ
jgi:hypothetical protein